LVSALNTHCVIVASRMPGSARNRTWMMPQTIEAIMPAIRTPKPSRMAESLEERAALTPAVQNKQGLGMRSPLMTTPWAHSLVKDSSPLSDSRASRIDPAPGTP
jgi:hypothetical protein